MFDSRKAKSSTTDICVNHDSVHGSGRFVTGRSNLLVIRKGNGHGRINVIGESPWVFSARWCTHRRGWKEHNARHRSVSSNALLSATCMRNILDLVFDPQRRSNVCLSSVERDDLPDLTFREETPKNRSSTFPVWVPPWTCLTDGVLGTSFSLVDPCPRKGDPY